jgi:hypothetical protein
MDRTTQESATKRFIDRLAQWFTGGSELAHLTSHEVERMAHDCGMSADQLRNFVSMAPGAADLLHVRLGALGLSTADIDRIAFGLTRDLERDCSCCCSKEQCAKDLEERPSAAGWMAYCANAQTLDAAARLKGRVMI